MKWIGGARRAYERAKRNSPLNLVAEAWAGIEDKSGWEAAAAVYGTTAYKLFTKDQSYRIKNGIAGVATPSELYQYTIRKVDVSDHGSSDVCGIFRRRHISNLPAKISISVAISSEDVWGHISVVGIVFNKVRGHQWPTLWRLGTLEGGEGWVKFEGWVYPFIADRVSAVGIGVCFEDYFEGSVLIDNARIVDHGVDRYVGWRQNPGTDDWQVVPADATITQQLVYANEEEFIF